MTVTAGQVAAELIKPPAVVVPTFLSAAELIRRYPTLREPVIHGLLRRGETMNLIAASKTGKSWMTLALGISIPAGRPWLGTFATEADDVLLIDNELHPETIAYRINLVARSLGIQHSDFQDRLSIHPMRGKLHDIHQLSEHLRNIMPRRYSVIILDAFYRFMPPRTDENDNAAMATIYNRIDHLADLLQCSFVLVHHASKGDQSPKGVTDVGAGAGSQSRATDAHVILRPHAQPHAVVLEAALRSWPPLVPVCLRWRAPIWEPAPDLDPADLRKPNPRKVSQKDKRTAPTTGTETSFVESFVTAEPVIRDTILSKAEQAGVSTRQAGRLLNAAVDQGLCFRWPGKQREKERFSTQKPPEEGSRVCARAHPPHPPEVRERTPGLGKRVRARISKRRTEAAKA